MMNRYKMTEKVVTTYMEDLLAENALPENDYPKLKEPVEADDEPIQN